MKLYFYNIKDAYGEFSNFSRHSITLSGKVYPTSEHYFQSQKFAGVNPEREEQVRQAATPREAANMGRDRGFPVRSDWEQVKDDVMLAALRAKFTQHPELKSLLLSTDEQELVEKTTDDYYWGCGTQGTGKNKLGELLMRVRTELRRKA
ncbi:MAG TPA: NADAR family protein [Chloroflexia bacterium]|nr:NADAR family protein [Chloroflexia bacterium]